MKYSFIAAFTALALLTPALSLAAGVVLSNGGFGQAAGNPQNFGVAVCNHGTETVTQSVPVSVTVGDRSTSIMSGAPIKAGTCSYRKPVTPTPWPWPLTQITRSSRTPTIRCRMTLRCQIHPQRQRAPQALKVRM